MQPPNATVVPRVPVKNFDPLPYRCPGPVRGLAVRAWLMVLALLAGAASSAQVPHAVLAGLDGGSHRLAEYIGAGHWTVVNIWGPGCPPCVEEMPELAAFHDEHARSGASVLGIAIDFPSFGQAKADEVRRFVDDYLIDFPVLLADHRIFQVLAGRPLPAVPASLVYRPDGTLAAVHVGALNQAQLEGFLARHDERFR